MKKYVKIVLKDGKQIQGLSLRINKKDNLMIVKDLDKLVELKPNSPGYEPLREPVGSKIERTYIPIEHILYWQKIQEKLKVNKNDS